MEATIRIEGQEDITAEVNGSSFITEDAPEFPEEAFEAEIETEDGVTVIEHAVVVECASVDGRYWFTIIEQDPRDRALQELREDTETALNELLDFVVGGE